MRPAKKKESGRRAAARPVRSVIAMSGRGGQHRDRDGDEDDTHTAQRSAAGRFRIGSASASASLSPLAHRPTALSLSAVQPSRLLVLCHLAQLRSAAQRIASARPATCAVAVRPVSPIVRR